MARFTAADIAALRKADLIFLISYAIVHDSYTPGSTGTVKEIAFRFEANSYFHSIHPDKFQALEEGIKANVKFTLIKADKSFTGYTMTTVINSSYF
ncbi:MAG: hypothetical protein LUD68_00120 [Rikenellaceae bacterium]|nr:hypothetical protein [Rikenellaceae bacterium]